MMTWLLLRRLHGAKTTRLCYGKLLAVQLSVVSQLAVKSRGWFLGRLEQVTLAVALQVPQLSATAVLPSASSKLRSSLLPPVPRR